MTGADPGAWQRLPPAAIIHFVVKGVTEIVRHGWQGLAAGGIGIGAAGGDMRGILIWLAVAAFVAVVLAAGCLQYWHFRYRAGRERFEARQGVLQRQAVSLNYGRVQSVSILQPLYFKPFGLVSLKLESAGSSAQELDVAGISQAFAERVRSHVLRRRASAAAGPGKTVADDAGPATPGADERLVLRRSLGEIARHGLCSNNLWIFAAFAGSLAGAANERLDTLVTPRMESGFERLVDVGPAGVVLGALVLALAFIAVVAGLSVLASIALHHDFRLYRGGNGLRRRSGLLHTREASLTESKAQCLVRTETPVGLLLRRCEGRVVQAGKEAAFDREQPGAPSFVVPALTRAEFEDLARLLYSDYGERAEPLQRIDRAYIYKTLQYRWLPPTLLAAAAGWTVAGPWAASALALLPVGWLRTALAYRRYGYAMDSGLGRVSSGLVGRHLTVFPLFKVQSVTLRQSPFQRRKGLATLQIELAGRRLKLPYMPLADARAWRDRLLYAAETDRRAWI